MPWSWREPVMPAAWPTSSMCSMRSAPSNRTSWRWRQTRPPYQQTWLPSIGRWGAAGRPEDSKGANITPRPPNRKNEMADAGDHGLGRREFMQGVALTAAVPGMVLAASGSADKAAVLAQIPKMHAENIKRLQDWIALPSIAAEN